MSASGFDSASGSAPPRARVAFLTCDALRHGHEDDLTVVPPASALGIGIDLVPWRDPTPDWTRWDAVLIRTTWDYQHHAADYFARLEEIEAAGVPLWNPSGVARWNADKGYLADLAERGIAVVPSRFETLRDADHLADLIADHPEGAVVKPRVGASGEDTWLLAPGANGDGFAAAARALRGRRIVVQPFLASVLAEGEVSATFVDGRISHCFRKRPRAGEFRSQEEHGGRIEGLDDVDGFRAWATAVAAAVRELDGLLYYRIDALRDAGGRWCLGELELIEPKLYFTSAPGSADRFADALARRLDLDHDAAGPAAPPSTDLQPSPP